MSRRHELGMDSYDRLFPNQDTMPRGGFGNLIALPLQREAREHGNTIFLDDALRPISDQWAFLASVPRIPLATAELVAREAQQLGAPNVPPPRPKTAFDRYFDAQVRDPAFAAAYTAAREEIDREQELRAAAARTSLRRRAPSDRRRVAAGPRGGRSARSRCARHR